MPLLHCNLCHGEWEGEKDSTCYDCGAGGYILAEQTPLEMSMKHMEELIKELDVFNHNQ